MLAPEACKVYGASPVMPRRKNSTLPSAPPAFAYRPFCPLSADYALPLPSAPTAFAHGPFYSSSADFEWPSIVCGLPPLISRRAAAPGFAARLPNAPNCRRRFHPFPTLLSLSSLLSLLSLTCGTTSRRLAAAFTPSIHFIPCCRQVFHRTPLTRPSPLSCHNRQHSAQNALVREPKAVEDGS